MVKILGNKPEYKGIWKSVEGRVDLVEGKIFPNVIWPDICSRDNPIHKRYFYFMHNSKGLNIHMKL